MKNIRTKEKQMIFCGSSGQLNVTVIFILLIRDMVVESCNRRFGRETIHPTKKINSMKLLQMSCVIT